jgi:hypothetical protein
MLPRADDRSFGHPRISVCPLVSFLIPVRNAAHRLDRCLASIRATESPADCIEIIVIDNGSSDESVEVARKWRATVLERPRLPLGALRNAGASAASGGVLAFVDADHEITPSWVRWAVEGMRDPTVGAVGSLCDSPPDGTWVQRAYDLLRRRPEGVREVEWLGSGNMAVRRRAFDAADGFDVRLQTCEDIDLCRRIRSRGYRILHDSRLRSVHFGDPATLRDVFRGELWRGRDNVRVSFRGRLTARGMPSVLIPLGEVALLALVALGLISAQRSGVMVAGLALTAMLSVAAARTMRMLGNLHRITLAACTQAFIVAAVYDLARALAIVGLGSHQNRSVTG